MNRRKFLAGTIALQAVGRGLAAAADSPLVSVAVIGHTGRGDYGHELDTLWLDLPGSKVVAVADSVVAGREKAAARLGGVRAYADYRKMLEEIQPTIISIAPRHVDQRLEMVTAAIDAGVKGIYIEKPFAPTPAAADEILRRAREAGVRIAVAHRMRSHPVLPVLKRALADGLIGQILEIRGRGKEDHRGGMLDTWVLGSHVFNIMTYFAGPAVSCSANILDGDRPVTPADIVSGPEGVGPIAGDRVHARFFTESGLVAYFDSIRGAGTPEAGFGLQIIGNEGMIDLRIDREPFAHFRRGNPFDVGVATPWVPFTTGGPDVAEPVEHLGRKVMSHRLLAGDLLAAVREGRAPLCDAAEGARTVDMISAIMASHRAGGETVSLPLAGRGHPLAGWE